MRVIDRCEFRGRREGAAGVVRPPGLGDGALREAGRLACRGEPACTACFWDDAALAPGLPPTPELPMFESQADAAVAVHIASGDRLCRATAGRGGGRGA